MMANNALPLSLLDASAATVRQRLVRRQVCAAHHPTPQCRRELVTCSRHRDIHKNLWISLWIFHE